MPKRAMVCLRLAADTVASDLAALERHRAEVDLAELHADRLSAREITAAARLPALAGVPLVLAVRRRRDGGGWDGDERDRAAVFARLAGGPTGGGFAFAELEDDFRPILPGVRVIRTLRDPHGVPGDLETRLRGLAGGAGELPKAEVAVRGSADLARLLGVCARTRDVDKAIVGTGPGGHALGVLASRLGSAFSCVVPAGTDADEGCPDPTTLRDRYRFAAIDAGTPLTGVIGDPVMHSLSPVIHNRGMAALGIPGVYLPFPVDDLRAFFAAADILGIRGLSVTVPHKEAVVPFLATRDPTVERVGACNTLVRPGPGAGWHGANTDVEGFLAPLRRVLAGRVLRGMNAVVVGAGGAARAVVAALTAEGVDVVVLNRTVGRAREVADRFGCRWDALDASGVAGLTGRVDLIVQTSSVGLGDAASDPLPDCRLTGREIVYDLVYAPRVTPLLARANAAGCTTISGISMLLAQALGQFRLFTGFGYPREALAALEQEL